MYNHRDERSIWERKNEVSPWLGELNLSEKHYLSSNSNNDNTLLTYKIDNGVEDGYLSKYNLYSLDHETSFPLIQSEVRDVFINGGYLQIDFDKAQRNNDIFAKTLGWDLYYIDLYNLFGFKESPGINSPEFIEAVVRFQWDIGMDEKNIDGIIGPTTWTKIVKRLISLNDPLTGKKLDDAIRDNRKLSLNWGNNLGKIQKVIGHHDQSSLNESTFAKLLALWQKNNNVLPVDGTLGTITWSKLSLKLGDFDDSIQVEFSVNLEGVIRPEKGVRLYFIPIPNSIQSPNVIGNGEKIDILGFNPRKAPGWVRVKSRDGEIGWLPSFYLIFLTDFDRNIFKEEYYVQQDSTLTDVVKSKYASFYKNGKIRIGFDERTIIEAIVLLNENVPNSAIYYKGEGSKAFWRDNLLDRDMAALRDMYLRVKIKQNQILYLPHDDYIEFLFSSGVLSKRAEWKNDAIVVGKSLYGFYKGIRAGLDQAALDTITGLWELLKGIVTGSIFSDVMDLIKTIEQHGIKIIDLLIEAGGKKYEKLKADLAHPNPEKRFYSIGMIVGFIIFEVVLALLTAGAGNAAGKISKIKKVEEILDKFPNIKKITNKINIKTVDKLDETSKVKALDLVIAGFSALDYIENLNEINLLKAGDPIDISQLDERELAITDNELYSDYQLSVQPTIPGGKAGEDYILNGLLNRTIPPLVFYDGNKKKNTEGVKFFLGQYNKSNNGVDIFGVEIDPKGTIQFYIIEVKGGIKPKIGTTVGNFTQLGMDWNMKAIENVFADHHDPVVIDMREKIKENFREVFRKSSKFLNLKNDELDDKIKAMLLSHAKKNKILRAIIVSRNIDASALKRMKDLLKRKGFSFIPIRHRELNEESIQLFPNLIQNLSTEMIEFEGFYGLKNISKIGRKIAQLTNNEFTSSNWFKNIVKPSFLGLLINDGVHLVLWRKLQEAETWLLAQPQYQGMTSTGLGQALGLDHPRVRYSGARLSNKKEAMHGFGLAIDIHPVGNPWIGAGWVKYDEKLLLERTRMLQTLRKASSDTLQGDNVFQYLHSIAKDFGQDTRQAYQVLQQRNQEFVTYLKNNPTELRYWKKSATFSDRDPLNGFLNLHPDLVYALREVAGLAWGAIDFGPRASGDIMHFDLRTQGVSKAIAEHISAYIPEYGHPYLTKVSSQEVEDSSDDEYIDYESAEWEHQEAIEETEWEDPELDDLETLDWEEDPK